MMVPNAWDHCWSLTCEHSTKEKQKESKVRKKKTLNKCLNTTPPESSPKFQAHIGKTKYWWS